ncbi:MAG: DUF4282 domain-containing protein [Chloroflexota bacterium]|nr:DUF4282 domain-containing protein [Chloroflexota bacterium]
MNTKRFFSFERMITPAIIKIIFWIGFIGSIIGGIVVFATSLISGISDGGVFSILLGLVGGALVGILAFAVGALITRIYCELMILVFRINETLTDIKVLLEKNQPGE